MFIEALRQRDVTRLPRLVADESKISKENYERVCAKYRERQLELNKEVGSRLDWKMISSEQIKPEFWKISYAASEITFLPNGTRIADEELDDWRGEFYLKLKPVVSQCRDTRSAVLAIHKWLWSDKKVKFAVDESRDRSPRQTMKIGIGRCFELNLLFTALLRSACIPYPEPRSVRIRK